MMSSTSWFVRTCILIRTRLTEIPSRMAALRGDLKPRLRRFARRPAPPFRNPCPAGQAWKRLARRGFSPVENAPMSVTATRRPAIRSLKGWAIATLQESGAIVECEQHGWMQERGDPHARGCALRIARDDPPPG